MTTFGMGAPVVSTLEDLVSTIMAVVALVVPILCGFFMIFFGWYLFRSFKRFTSKSRPIMVNARPTVVPAMAGPAGGPPASSWQGGV
jgi:hypothetical protein